MTRIQIRLNTSSAFTAVQFKLVSRCSHRRRIMNFEPGNQEREERVASLILFASDFTCKRRSEEEKKSALACARLRSRARHRANWLSVSAERNFEAQSFGRIQPRNSMRIIRRLVDPFLHT